MADFDLYDRPLVWIPVKFPGLSQPDGDEVAVAIMHEVELQVEILDREQFAEWMQLLEADAENAGTVDRQAENRSVTMIVKGWRKVKARGRTVEFNEENLRRLLAWPNFVTALGTSYMKAWQGQAETRLGNSASSPAGGRAGEATGATTAAETPTS